MKTDELKKELISAIEKAFEKYEPEFIPFVPKIGQWVKGINNYRPYNPALVLSIDKIMCEYDDFAGDHGFHSYSDGANLDFMRPATVQEIESHLKKIAIEKGFKNGVTIIGLRFNSPCKMFWQGEHEHSTIESECYPVYDSKEDKVNVYDGKGGRYDLIYSKGSWAEILPSLKKRPETREQFIEFIDKLSNEYYDEVYLGKIIINKFLDQYDL